MKAKISVICPLYKGQQYIEEIVKTIEKNQKNLGKGYGVELIFVNDFPEEDIYITSNADLEDLRLLVNESNVGIHQSRVNGLLASTGDYILFLDQDDKIEAWYLKSQMEKLGSASAIVCNGIWRTNKQIYDAVEQQRETVCKKKYFPYIVSPGQVLIKRDSIPVEWCTNILKHNGCDDAFLWNLMLSHSEKFKCNRDKLYTHVEHNENASGNFEEMYHSLQECFDKYEKLSDAIKSSEYIEFKNRRLETYRSYIILTTALEKAEKNKEKILAYLERLKISNVAVYGYGCFGQKLCNLLKKSGVEIAYVIDREKSKYLIKQDILMFSPDEKLPPCDLLIITPIVEYSNIKEKIQKKIGGMIQSMDKFLECRL